MPTYHLANVVDDYLMQITHVIRGEEWLPSAPLHQLLYDALGWRSAMPQFAHLPLLLKPNGNGKLSKRDGDQLGLPFYAIAWHNADDNKTTNGYRECGYLPQAYINFLALLGWSSGGDHEIFDIQELIQKFSIQRIHHSGARYDFDKLKFFNEHYLHHLTSEQLADQVQALAPSFAFDIHTQSHEYLVNVCALVKERLSFTTDFDTKADYFYVAPASYDAQVVSKKWKSPIGNIIQNYADNLSQHPAQSTDFDAHTAQQIFETTCAQHATAPNAAMQCLRLATTGQSGGAALFEVIALIGKPETINRLHTAVSILG
jgi:glutamyl-tRNA synthetase